MLKFLQSHPTAKLEKSLRKKMSDAADAQRAGKIPLYAVLSAEAEEIRKKLEDLRPSD